MKHNSSFVDNLFKKVQAKKISSWKAATILGISLRDFLDELGKRDIPTFDEKSFLQDLEFVKKYS